MRQNYKADITPFTPRTEDVTTFPSGTMFIDDDGDLILVVTSNEDASRLLTIDISNGTDYTGVLVCGTPLKKGDTVTLVGEG